MSTIPQELDRQATYWASRAQTLEITDLATLETAAGYLQAVKGLQAEIDKTFDPIITKAYAAHKEACAQKKRYLEPLLQAEALLKRSMGAYVEEQERIQREEERRLREEADRLAAEQREREIEEAESAGASVEEIQIIAQAPLERRPVVSPSLPRVQGISSREVWKAEVTNLHALVKYVAGHPDYMNLLQPNLTAINALARSLRAAMNVPGIRAFSDTNIAARRAN